MDKAQLFAAALSGRPWNPQLPECFASLLSYKSLSLPVQPIIKLHFLLIHSSCAPPQTLPSPPSQPAGPRFLSQKMHTTLILHEASSLGERNLQGCLRSPGRAERPSVSSLDRHIFAVGIFFLKRSTLFPEGGL